MKINYKKNILKAFGLIAAVGLMSSCSDEFGFDSFFTEGEPVTLSIDCTVGEMPKISRGDIASGRDKEINSLWVAFYGADGQRKYKFSFDNAEQVGTMDSDFKTLTNLEITSGRYYIVVVANYEGNMGVTADNPVARELSTLLEEAETFDRYKEIAVYSEPGLVATPVGNLVMQGVYLNNHDHVKDLKSDFWAENASTLTEIRPDTKKLAGAIHFRRLISQVKFNISYNAAKISSFEPVSMTIYNVPSVSWLAERKDGTAGNADTNAGDGIELGSEGPEFATSRRFYNFESNENIRTIDWWQMENRRQAVKNITKYSEREYERKTPVSNSDKYTNRGIYTALCGDDGETYIHNNSATYAELRVRLNMNDSRSVDAVYTIHLGYCEGNDEAEKSPDFNCRRNHKYTYNINIDDVDKIRIEAESDELDGDFQHGAEGVITEITNAFFTADSHFEQRNVYLSNDDLNDLKWSMRIYKSQREFVTIDQDNYKSQPSKYWDWIEFVPTTEDVCATYPGRGSESIIKLKDLAAKGTEGWYTMFIDEYIYEDDTTEPDVPHGNLTPSWKEYVNLPDRTMWLKVEEARSADQESVIVKSKYAVQQKSLQTYYGINPENPAQSMALEHVAEHGYMLFSPYDFNSEIPKSPATRGGRYLLAKFLNNENDFTGTTMPELSSPWSNYITQSQLVINNDGNKFGVPALSTLTLIGQCLNRNRDLNGNTKIDADEIRWFLPNINQYIRFVMGAHSLKTPLYDFSGKKSDQIEFDHFGSAEGWILWAEEFLSTGPISFEDNAQANNIRCMRYLGVNMQEFAETPAQPAFEKRDNNRIVFHYATEASRLTPVTVGVIPVHLANSEYNRPYAGLEYKPQANDIIIASQYYATPESWFNYLKSNNPCAEFNKDGEIGWRVPNQVEITAMLMLDVLPSGLNYYLSCSQEFFGLRVFAVDTDKKRVFAGNQQLLNSIEFEKKIRCVRDVRVE